MNTRLELHEFLVSILGSRNVYYQPPESVKMQYPAIVYEKADIRSDPADNIPYKQSHFYTITVIDYDPDSEIVDRLSKIPRIGYDRHFTSNNLNHDVFTLYY